MWCQKRQDFDLIHLTLCSTTSLKLIFLTWLNYSFFRMQQAGSNWLCQKCPNCKVDLNYCNSELSQNWVIIESQNAVYWLLSRKAKLQNWIAKWNHILHRVIGNLIVVDPSHFHRAAVAVGHFFFYWTNWFRTTKGFQPALMFVHFKTSF